MKSARLMPRLTIVTAGNAHPLQWSQLRRLLRCRVLSGAASGRRICAGYFIRKRFAIRPDRTVREMLLLPDRHGAFQGIDEPAAGIKAGGAMSRGHRNQHAGLTDFEPPEPVDEGNVADFELLQCLAGEGFHLLQRHALVRLIIEVERLSSASLVANHPLKNQRSAVFSALQP